MIDYKPIVVLTSKKIEEGQEHHEHKEVDSKSSSNSNLFKAQSDLRNVYPAQNSKINESEKSPIMSITSQLSYSPSKSTSPSKIMSMNQIKRFRMSRRNRDYIKIDGSVINSKHQYSSMRNTRTRLQQNKAFIKNLSSQNPLKYFHNANLNKTNYGGESDYPTGFNDTRLFNFSTLKSSSKRNISLTKRLSCHNKAILNYSSRKNNSQRKRSTFSITKREATLTQEVRSKNISPFVKNLNSSGSLKPKARQRIKVNFPISKRLTQEESLISIRASQELSGSSENMVVNKPQEPRVNVSIQESDYVDLKHRYSTYEDRRNSKSVGTQQKNMDVIVPFCTAKVTLKKRPISTSYIEEDPCESSKETIKTIVVRKSMLDPRCKLKRKLVPHSLSKPQYSSLKRQIALKNAQQFPNPCFNRQESDQNKDLLKILKWRRII
ncbi:unnamed protein product [Moneuplotes crassus]|uniref:Uncharacterized protein n=1 Tax=Euplotes crassus TaxID=5936 RepID=A0AAD1UEQ0_EUPCR|nr:unnamed protein product [Moneuplotes crassus]